jgi:hypothetical protein
MGYGGTTFRHVPEGNRQVQIALAFIHPVFVQADERFTVTLIAITAEM